MGQYGTLKYVDVRGAFAKPSTIAPLNPEDDEKEYPAPGIIQEMIISILSERYIRYYRTLQVPNNGPNTQTDPVT